MNLWSFIAADAILERQNVDVAHVGHEDVAGPDDVERALSDAEALHENTPEAVRLLEELSERTLPDDVSTLLREMASMLASHDEVPPESALVRDACELNLTPAHAMIAFPIHKQVLTGLKQQRPDLMVWFDERIAELDAWCLGADVAEAVVYYEDIREARTFLKHGVVLAQESAESAHGLRNLRALDGMLDALEAECTQALQGRAFVANALLDDALNPEGLRKLYRGQFAGYLSPNHAQVRSLLDSDMEALMSSGLYGPERMLNQIMLALKDALVWSKNHASTATRDEKKIKQQLEMQRAQSKNWEKKAMVAVRAGKDGLAKQALMRKYDHDNLIARYEVLWGEQKRAAESRRTVLRALGLRIEACKRQKALMITGRHQKRAPEYSAFEDSGAFPALSNAFDDHDDEGTV